MYIYILYSYLRYCIINVLKYHIMIDKIISYSVNNKLIIGLMTLALIATGLWSMKQVPLDAVPDITNNQVQIITTSPNLGTTDIEQFVTYPVELAMANLPGVNEIRSVSRFGLSVVTVVFEESMGTYLPRQVVSEKLNEVKNDIPKNFGSPAMGPISSGLGEIYQYSLQVDKEFANKYTSTKLRSIQDWIIRRQLAMVEGVVEINTIGGKQKQYEIAIDPDKLQSYKLSISDVYKAIDENNSNTGGAYIEKDHKASFIRGEGILKSTKDIENILVSIKNNTPILVKDLAKVHIGSAIRYGALTQNGKETVGGIIMMIKDGNSNEVITKVKERIVDIQKSLPEGVKIVPLLDRSKLIYKTTSTVAGNLLEGGLIVIFILVILLGNWRGGLIVASTIPLSLFFAFIMMNIFGVWANLMSLGAIDFGIIVDGSVIIVESIVFYISRGGNNIKTKSDMDAISIKSSSKMMNAAFFGQFIILIVFIPILALEGVEGKMFRPMAQTFAFALIGAMILCLTYVPMISSIFLKAKKDKKLTFGDKIILKIENFFEPILSTVLKKTKIVITLSIILLSSAVFIFSRMGGEFIPQLDEGDLAFHALLKPGSSLTEMVNTTKKIESLLLKEYPEVKDIASRIGVADIPTDPMPMDIADVFVILKDKKEWVSAESKDELISKMKKTLNTLPGVNYEFTQPIEMRFNELLTGVREDVAIKLFGEDLDVLAAKAQEIGSLITGIQGVADMRIEATAGLPQITIDYNNERLALYGVSIKQLNELVSSAFAGAKAGVIFEGEKRFDLVLRLQDKNRSNINDIKNLYVNIPNGSQIPLRELADISYKSGPMQITRENTNRRTYVGINVRGRDVKSLVNEIQDTLDSQLDLPAGYYIRYGGAFENLERATGRLKIVIPIALALIFMLIFFALKSFKQSIMIFMAIPFACIGGIYALYLRDMPFSISAGVGFIVLFGVAVLNGLVLIGSLNELKENGVENIKDRIIAGVKSRIRPIILTASTDVLGFLPMAISSSAGAEVQRPLATVVIGGLITATMLTLLVLPILYQYLETKEQKTKKKIKMNKTALAGIFIFCMIGSNINAQEKNSNIINLKELISTAKKNYPGFEINKLEIEKKKHLLKTSIDMGISSISYSSEGMGGATDSQTSGFNFAQNEIDIFSIGAKSSYNKKNLELSQSLSKIDDMTLERSIRQDWTDAIKFKMIYQLSKELNSIYVKFENSARLKYEYQEASKLEYLWAKNESRQIEISMYEANKNYKISLLKLNFWMKSDKTLDVEIISNKDMLNIENKTLDVSHPYIKAAQEKQALDLENVNLKKKALLPKLNLEYGIQKIANKTGFYKYQIGISLPIFNRTEKANIRFAKTQADISQLNVLEKQLTLKNNIDKTYLEYTQLKQSVDILTKESLLLSEEQIKGAQFAYKAGELDYIQFSTNLKQAIDIKLKYIYTFNKYMQAYNSLMFFTNKQ